MASVTRAVTAPARSFTRRAQGQPVSTALFLFGLLLLVVWLRAGRQLPDRRRVLGLLVGAGIVVASATVAPDFVTAILAATLLAVALDQSSAITDAIRYVEQLLGASPAPASAPGNVAGLRPV